MNNFPDHDFKIDCGDDPAVRQWLHDNGCRWLSGNYLLELCHDVSMLLISDLKVQHCEEDADWYANSKLPQINPFDYMQPEPTVKERMSALIEEYKGDIPECAKWIAVCKTGSLEWGSDKPVLRDDYCWHWYANNQNAHCAHITYVQGLKDCWRETLTELPTVKRELIVEDKPADNRAEIAALDERDLSPAEADYAVKLDAKQWADKECNKPQPLTIPSICLAEPTSHMMMLGGEHGGRCGE